MQVFWKDYKVQMKWTAGDCVGQASIWIVFFFGSFPMGWRKNMKHQTKWAKCEGVWVKSPLPNQTCLQGMQRGRVVHVLHGKAGADPVTEMSSLIPPSRPCATGGLTQL